MRGVAQAKLPKQYKHRWFCVESGSPSNPSVILIHGFPSQVMHSYQAELDVVLSLSVRDYVLIRKAMLFLNFSNEYVDTFKSKYRKVAASFRRNDILFSIGDVDASQATFQYFGLKEDQAPLIIIQEQDAKKSLKEKLEPEQIATWVKEYTEGSLTPFRKLKPIPENNIEYVMVVVADILHDVVINSKKNG